MKQDVVENLRENYIKNEIKENTKVYISKKILRKIMPKTKQKMHLQLTRTETNYSRFHKVLLKMRYQSLCIIK